MLDSLVTGGLKIVQIKTPAQLVVEWRGEADDRHPTTTIRPFLDTIAAQALSAQCRVVLDLDNLLFMNSSCIGSIVNFVKSLDEKGGKVTVLFNTRHTWQILSQRCMKTIFARTENVTIVDRAQVK